MAEDSPRLSSVKEAFDAQKFEEAASILKSMPKDDLKVKHSLAIVQFIMGEIDSEEALSILSDGGLNGTIYKSQSSPDRPSFPVILQYEGHETTYYNISVILARSGRPHEASALLHRLLELGNTLSVPVLARCISLYRIITHSVLQSTESNQDEKLIDPLLNANLHKFTDNKELMNMINMAFGDSSALHEIFKSDTATATDTAVYFNNLGVASLKDMKTNVASLCFAKAKSSADKSGSFLLQKPIDYNLGLSALFSGDFHQALAHFLPLQQQFKFSPLFWTRIAEAAVEILQQIADKKSREVYTLAQETSAKQLRDGSIYPGFPFLMLPGASSLNGLGVSSAASDAAEITMEQLASGAIRNSLYLLIPKDHTASRAFELFPANFEVLTFTLYYWCCLEIHRGNYNLVISIGEELLSIGKKRELPSSLHTALLSMMVEALVYLNDPEKALKILRESSFIQLLTPKPSFPIDATQKCRVETLFLNSALAHILNGSLSNAQAILESVVAKIIEGKSDSDDTGSKEGCDVLFAHCVLTIFLEIIQGNQEKAEKSLKNTLWNI